MSNLDDRILELALQTSNEPMLIIDGKLIIAWANLAAVKEHYRAPGRGLEEFLADVHPMADYFQPQRALRLRRKISTLPVGQVAWRLPQQDPDEVGASNMLIRWKRLSESSDKYTLITIQHFARRRTDPGPAEQSLRSQQVFMNQLIHELRTPLAIAQASLRRAGIKLDSSLSASGEYLNMVSQELKRMQRLIDHLSVLTDLDAKSNRWKMRSVLVCQQLKDWHHQLPEVSRARVAFYLLDEVGGNYISVDPEALNLVLNNILDNALRYSSPDLGVVVLFAAQDGCLRICVADWGVGIPETKKESVFDRFHRLEEHRDPSRADGAGLGLAVCRAVLGVMNGQITLLPSSSERSLEGEPKTVMMVLLPLLRIRKAEDLPELDPSILLIDEAQSDSCMRVLNYVQALK